MARKYFKLVFISTISALVIALFSTITEQYSINAFSFTLSIYIIFFLQIGIYLYMDLRYIFLVLQQEVRILINIPLLPILKQASTSESDVFYQSVSIYKLNVIRS